MKEKYSSAWTKKMDILPQVP
uniref:Uncharacterized protein n=1 Tax=Anguilla anguilla TaxID=7936 RepID=A0A0E9TQZ4_ANGAN